MVDDEFSMDDNVSGDDDSDGGGDESSSGSDYAGKFIASMPFRSILSVSVITTLLFSNHQIESL